MTRGLALVLTPNGKIPGGYPPFAIDYAYKGATDWYGSNSAGDLPGVANTDPHQDPKFLTRGEQGYYYDTMLGRPSGQRSPSLRGLGRGLAEGLSLSPNVVAGITTLGMIGGGVFGYKRAQKAGDKKFWPTVGFGLLGSIIATAATRVVGWAKPATSTGVQGFPTDFQLATIREYLPVEGGWIPLQDNKILTAGPWIPPHGTGGRHDPRFPVPVISAQPNELAGLGRMGNIAPAPIVPTVPGSTASVDDVVGVMVAHNDRAFALALVSTTAVAVSALLGVFRTLKLIREDSSRD